MRVVPALAAALALAASSAAWTAARKRQAPAPDRPGKLAVALAAIPGARIELPDGTARDYGAALQARLTTLLTQSGRYVVVDPEREAASSRVTALGAAPSPGYAWPGSAVPAATLRISVRALGFTAGSRGERMFYGFDDRVGQAKEEFPLRTDGGANWFGRFFDGEGSVPFDSRSGLDLGDGFSIDALFAWLSVKYASYRADIDLRIGVDAPLAGRNDFSQVRVTGRGFFFDVAGAYEGYSAGIRLARADAMDQAIHKSFDGASGAIDRALADIPLTARVDEVLPEGIYLLGTGHSAEVRVGTRYRPAGGGDAVLEVVAGEASGAVARLAGGDASSVPPGTVLVQRLADEPRVASLSERNVPISTESVRQPASDLARARGLDELAPRVSAWDAFWKSLVEGIFLPYRIWRFFQYDQAYHADADGGGSSLAWRQGTLRQPWAARIGLAEAGEMSVAGDPPVVAVIDTGVDYNHPAIHDRLWLNPSPTTDLAGRVDRYGWDFVSNDSRPYDDAYHGTELASAVLAVAPGARIMALKAFNAWGVTSSAALAAGFAYAADHGARVILCGWATPVASDALEKGVEYARSRGALVVAAAGDDGWALSLAPVYPAAWSARIDNVLAVAALDEPGRAVISNADSSLVGLAAPGAGVRVARPRGDETSGERSSGIAAALVAGAAARVAAALGPTANAARLIEALSAEADAEPGLAQAVRGGLTLRIGRN